jgi:hypothetical protein
MKLVYSHGYSQVGMVRSMLENERIPSVIRNHRLMGDAAYGPVELWVADEDFFLAQSIINQRQNNPEDQLEDWMCPRCGAQNEGNMAICWNCDYEIDGPAV